LCFASILSYFLKVRNTCKRKTTSLFRPMHKINFYRLLTIKRDYFPLSNKTLFFVLDEYVNPDGSQWGTKIFVPYHPRVNSELA
ncbi:hypothetical protein COT68_03150, partial [bacterium (Candidatus Torokbacteria) CG09_land_8_20_14_0_10_42_11]